MRTIELVGRDCYRAAKKLWGTGWQLLSATDKYNAVARQVVSVLMAQTEQYPDTLSFLQNVARHAATQIETEKPRP